MWICAMAQETLTNADALSPACSGFPSGCRWDFTQSQPVPPTIKLAAIIYMAHIWLLWECRCLVELRTHMKHMTKWIPRDEGRNFIYPVTWKLWFQAQLALQEWIHSNDSVSLAVKPMTISMLLQAFALRPERNPTWAPREISHCIGKGFLGHCAALACYPAEAWVTCRNSENCHCHKINATKALQIRPMIYYTFYITICYKYIHLLSCITSGEKHFSKFRTGNNEYESWRACMNSVPKTETNFKSQKNL